MSEPLSDCLVFAAARGNGAKYRELLATMQYNLTWGGYTQFRCDCQPPCPEPTEEQMASLSKRLQADLYVADDQHDSGDG